MVAGRARRILGRRAETRGVRFATRARCPGADRACGRPSSSLGVLQQSGSFAPALADQTTTTATTAATGPARASRSRAVRDVLVAFVASRVLVAVTAAIAATAFSASTSPSVPTGKEIPGISHPFGHGWLAGALDAVFTPLVRWDALWYLQISHGGYEPAGLGVAGNPGARGVFFPLYPLLVQVFGGWAGNGATVVVATLLSLVAFGVGLLVVHRLAELELGPEAARGAVLVLAFWPASYFFSAPYTESLFLALSAGAFLAARTDRWWLAGLLAAAASGTRNTGVLLLVPLAILYFYGPRGVDGRAVAARAIDVVRSWRPRFRPRADVLWLALVPLGLIAFCVYLQTATGSWDTWRTAQEDFGRAGLSSPTTTVHLALTGAYHAVRDGLGGSGGPNLVDLGAFAILVVAVIGMTVRLPLAYVSWVVVSVGPALLTPFAGEAMRSLPRFMSVLFPVAIWLGYELTRRRLLVPAVAVSAALLVVLTAAFTSWLPYV
jgi:Mannosyltransferase (PIG-V)